MDFLPTAIKVLNYSLILTIFLWIVLNYNLAKKYKTITGPLITNIRQHRNESLKYILIWTDKSTDPFYHFGKGRDSFVNPGCEINNCHITDDRNLLEIEKWDAILFHAPEYTWKYNRRKHGFPSSRSVDQIYIFSCIESSANYPICDNKWDSYFNWTMTYKIDSDVPWTYLTVKDLNGYVVAPRKNVKWTPNMRDIPENLKLQLKNKTKAVAWFVSNCYTKNHREDYVEKLKLFLGQSGLTLDIYGKCGEKKCPVEDKEVCWKYLREDYFFYLSFENSFSEDYTTEKLLQAMQNNVVPIVYGGSNYSRFAPPGSYINAKDYNPEALAELIKNTITNFEEYTKYFQWRNHYTYHSVYESYENHPFCNLCKSLNEPKSFDQNKYQNFRMWWNGDRNNDIYC